MLLKKLLLLYKTHYFLEKNIEIFHFLEIFHYFLEKNNEIFWMKHNFGGFLSIYINLIQFDNLDRAFSLGSR